MKKKILLVICCLITVSLCACGQLQGCGRGEKEEITTNEENSATEIIEETIESEVSEEEPVQLKVLVKAVETDESMVISRFYAYDEFGRVIDLRNTLVGKYTDVEYYSEYEYEADGSYIERVYMLSNSEVDTLISESTYDPNGNILLLDDYSFQYARDYIYDESGKLVEGSWFYLSGEGTDYSSWSREKYADEVYSFNDQGYLVEYQKVRVEGQVLSKTTYQYDDKGQLINEEQFECWPDEYFNQGYNYQYDEEGKLVYTTRYNEDAKGEFQTIEEITYEYDADGDLIKESSVSYWNSGNSSEETIIIYEYDYITIEE